MEDRAALQIWMTVALGLTSLIVIITRLVYRGMKRLFDVSDTTMAIALISGWVQNAINIDVAAQWGTGYHKAELPEYVLKSRTPVILLWLNQIFFKLTILCAKFSLFLVYHRLFRPPGAALVRWTHKINLVNGFIIATYYFAAFWVSIFQCTPVSKSWDKKQDGTCVNLAAVRYVTAYINIFTSALLVATPLPVLLTVKHKRRQITELIILVLLGFVHTGCAISRLVIMYYPESDSLTDPTWAQAPALTLAQVEMNVALIACSLVVMQPVIDKIYTCIPWLDVSMRSRWLMRTGRSRITDGQNSSTMIYGNYSNGTSRNKHIWSATRSKSAEERKHGLSRTRGADHDDEHDSDIEMIGGNSPSKINVTTEIRMQERNRSSLEGWRT